jgi:hypothetical protein
MTQLLRLKVNWTGFGGGPGYTNFHFGAPAGDWITPENITEAVTKLDTFLATVNGKLPASVSVKIDPTAETIAIADGKLIDFDAITPATRGSGTGTGNYSAPSGACINWYTGGIRNGRRVRGRTFIVPLAGSALSTVGNLDDGTLTQLTTAATALAAPGAGGQQLYVWGRPSAKGATDGVAYPVISARILDKVAMLTSRR